MGQGEGWPGGAETFGGVVRAGKVVMSVRGEDFGEKHEKGCMKNPSFG